MRTASWQWKSRVAGASKGRENHQGIVFPVGSLLDLRPGSGASRLPLKCGERLNMTVKVDSIEELDGKGINARLAISWNEVSSNQPVTVATFVLRYA